MFQLKKISRHSIPDALTRAERYRLLNEPRLAESICLDILEADPENKQAVIIQILAVTDQFGDASGSSVNEARQLLARLSGDYEKHYYAGIICERQGKAMLNKGTPDAHFVAYEWFADAMEHYEKAESMRPEGNDEALLRWNTCARLITRLQLKPRDEKFVEYPLE